MCIRDSVENSHEAIIPLEMFNAVQEERARRAERFRSEHPRQVTYPFTGKITCSCCEAKYNHMTVHGKTKWVCHTFIVLGKSKCAQSKAIPEDTLLSSTAEVLGLDEFDPEVFSEAVSGITAAVGNTLIYHFNDGSSCTVVWKDRSRSESWTPEMREAARRRALNRRRGK